MGNVEKPEFAAIVGVVGSKTTVSTESPTRVLEIAGEQHLIIDDEQTRRLYPYANVLSELLVDLIHENRLPKDNLPEDFPPSIHVTQDLTKMFLRWDKWSLDNISWINPSDPGLNEYVNYVSQNDSGYIDDILRTFEMRGRIQSSIYYKELYLIFNTTDDKGDETVELILQGSPPVAGEKILREPHFIKSEIATATQNLRNVRKTVTTNRRFIAGINFSDAEAVYRHPANRRYGLYVERLLY